MKIEERENLRTIRSITTQFETRNDSEEPTIEGYFAVFDSDYQIADGMSESVARTAFDNTLSGDIRALTDHDTTLVLGRTTNNTLELKTDEHGLWGKVKINPNDSDAMNLYERVKRGDVSQCSFGFEIVREESEVQTNGDIHWTIEEVNLFEVSCVTFPAYQSTSISARSEQAEEIKKRANEAWKLSMRNKLKGDSKDGIESVNAQEEN